MKIFPSAFEAGRWAPGCVAAIGKWDGLHVGQRKVLKLAVKRAAALKTRCVVLSFDPSPRISARLYPYKPILSEARKIELLAGLGVDAVVLIPFDEDLACMSPESFVNIVLSMQLKAKEICVGADFCFGKDRAGSVATLEEHAARMGLAVRSVPLAVAGGEKVSAARIRDLIDKGKMREAAKLLGRKLEALG